MPSISFYLPDSEYLVWGTLSTDERKKYMSALIKKIKVDKEQDDPGTDADS